MMNVAGELIGDCPHERASRERSYTLCRLTDEGDRDAQDPSWSAGGDKIAFKVDADIKVVSVSGGQAKLVLPPTHGVSAPAYDLPITGNVEAGRNIFFGKGGCAACHSIGGHGGAVGRD